MSLISGGSTTQRGSTLQVDKGFVKSSPCGENFNLATVSAWNARFREALFNASQNGMTSQEQAALTAIYKEASRCTDMYQRRAPGPGWGTQWAPLLQNIDRAEGALAQGVSEVGIVSMSLTTDPAAAAAAANAGADEALEMEYDPADYSYSEEDIFVEESFYQRHKTLIWAGGGLAVLGVGAYLIWGR
jgi:hypothetical protein